MMKEYYPEHYERLKHYIAEKRWFPAGSSVDECDVLIPSPESVLRQILYGNAFSAEFGTGATIFCCRIVSVFRRIYAVRLGTCGIVGIFDAETDLGLGDGDSV